jgi:ABC-type multidrug transport system fused ATPase/permease subunit
MPVVCSDRIMVLEDGHLREFDTPQNLINDPHTLFNSLIRSAENE